MELSLRETEIVYFTCFTVIAILQVESVCTLYFKLLCKPHMKILNTFHLFYSARSISNICNTIFYI